MKVVGVIAEFNPVHNGHVYFLKEVRKSSKCDCLVLALSSYATMRGDLAVLEPCERIKPILDLVDLVVLLPTPLLLNSADRFAELGVKVLAEFKVSEIYYGVESDFDFLSVKERFLNPPSSFKADVHASSFKKATNQLLGLRPNQLLGFFYEYASFKYNLNIKFYRILRVGNATDEVGKSLYRSSSEIRSDLSLLRLFAPQQTSTDFLFLPAVFPLLKYKLLTESKFHHGSNGISELVQKEIRGSSDLDSLLDRCTSKSITKTRIKRYLVSVLFNFKKSDYVYKYYNICYFSDSGRNLLHILKKDLLYYTKLSPVYDEVSQVEYNVSLIYKYLKKEFCK